MLRKLERDSLRADLEMVEHLLASRTSEADPVGHFQYTQRIARLQAELARLEQVPENTASVGIFFTGDPVIGSKGIRSEFAGKALDYFQELVAKTHASLEGAMGGRRGRVALRPESDLMVTDVVRGSVGFVLEEIEETGNLVDSKVKRVVDAVADTIVAVASPDANRFESALDGMDWRLISTLRDFFRLLDEDGAAIRIVEGNNDQSLDRESVHRARLRTEAATVDEEESEQITGKLYVLPAERRFELVPVDGSPAIHGIVGSEYSAAVLATLSEAPDNPFNKTWRTKMRIERITRPNRPQKIKYTLLGLLEEIITR